VKIVYRTPLVGITSLLVIAGCAQNPIPLQPTNADDPLFTAQSSLNALAPSLSVTRVSPPDGATNVFETSPITLTFSAPVDRVAVEQSASIFPGQYSPRAFPPSLFSKLNLTSMCDGRWRVQNPNASPVSFQWDIYGTPEQGLGVVPANAEVYFYSSKGTRTSRLFVKGNQRSVKAQNPAPCSTALGQFIWSADSTAVTLVPAEKMTVGNYTLVVSTGASGSQKRLAEPFVTSFSTIPEPRVGASYGETADYQLFSAEKVGRYFTTIDRQLWLKSRQTGEVRLAMNPAQFGTNTLILGVVPSHMANVVYALVRLRNEQDRPEDVFFEVNLANGVTRRIAGAVEPRHDRGAFAADIRRQPEPNVYG
jgi:hypothetical protein